MKNLSILKINTKTWKKYTEDLFDFEAEDMSQNEFKINQNDYNCFLYHEGIYLIYYNKNKDKDDKLIISKDLTEIKKKIIDGSMGKIVGEITNVSSNY